MVMNNENESAFKYIDTYSKLTRQILENSEKKWITVKAEISFLEMYLQIESLRFDHAFSYSITLENNVLPNSDKIPAMILQPVIENAIKHGLLSKDGEKKLSVSFNRKQEDAPLEVTIEDNGIGRSASANNTSNNEHQSMSLAITEHRLQLLDEKGGSKMIVTDLYDENGLAAGTRVTILIIQPD
jgi:LytS/YehU family sensor histidine kinase